MKLGRKFVFCQYSKPADSSLQEGIPCRCAMQAHVFFMLVHTYDISEIVAWKREAWKPLRKVWSALIDGLLHHLSLNLRPTWRFVS